MWRLWTCVFECKFILYAGYFLLEISTMAFSRNKNTSWRDAAVNAVRSVGWMFSRVQRLSPSQVQHNAIYDEEYYKFIEWSSARSRDVMADSIVRDLGPRTVVDIGCGTGALIDILRMRGVDVAGLERSDAALRMCKERGLDVARFDIGQGRLPSRLKNADVAISFEVAEHLPASLADRFVNLLTVVSKTVVLSAATPGQGGTDHLNEQPHSYWVEKLDRHGFVLNKQITERWRAEWAGKTDFWYSNNVMVFQSSQQQRRAA
jgi:SAM-dependent methyltransferase